MATCCSAGTAVVGDIRGKRRAPLWRARHRSRYSPTMVDLGPRGYPVRSRAGRIAVGVFVAVVWIVVIYAIIVRP